MATRLYFGGSFNPIHNGHLRCAAAVAEAGGYRQVVLVPSRQPPHKQADSTIAPAADRLAMCQLALPGTDDSRAARLQWIVDEIEMRREGPSYTIDTVRQLRLRGEQGPIHWLIGADMARYLPHWHDAEALLAEVHFVLMARPGWSFDWQTMPAGFRHLQANVVAAPLIDISSTEVRRRVAAGEEIDDLVPAAVGEYIRERGLYRSTGPTGA